MHSHPRSDPTLKLTLKRISELASVSLKEIRAQGLGFGHRYSRMIPILFQFWRMGLSKFLYP